MQRSWRYRLDPIAASLTILLGSAIAGCVDGPLAARAKSAESFATVTVEQRLANGDVASLTRSVRAIEATRDRAASDDMSDVAVRVHVTALDVGRARVGRSRQVEVDDTGRPIGTVTRIRKVAGAPFAIVELVDGRGVRMVARSEWQRDGGEYRLLSRVYERYVGDRLESRRAVSFVNHAGDRRVTWTPSVLTGSVAAARGFSATPSEAFDYDDEEGCGDGDGGGGMIRMPADVALACAAGGCGLKAAALALATAAAGIAFTSVVAGGLATIASGGLATPAEMTAIGVWLAAESVWVTRLDAYLECISEK